MSEEFQVSSEDIKYLSIPTLKKFVKHVLVVTKKQEDRTKAREALAEHLQKIKKEAQGNKKNKEKLHSHLAELENKVEDLLDKESKMLRSQEYENKTMHELRRVIQKQQEDIARKEEENRNLAQINRERMQVMQGSINSLRQMISNYIGERTNRDRRVQQLENKIKSEVDYKRPDDSKDQLRRLEQKYLFLEHKGTSQEILNKIRQRIQSMRDQQASS